MRIQRRNSGTSGFTMLELFISVVLLVGLILVVGLATRRATDAFDAGRTNDTLNSRAHRTLEKLIGDFEEVILPSLTPANQPLVLGDFDLTYTTVIGYAGGPTPGPPTQLALELDPGELDDGLDNDQDGFIDEGQVVWTENPGVAGERRVVVCKGVAEYLEGETPNGLDDNGNGLADERGFSVNMQGEVLTMRLTLQVLDPQGRPLTKTVQSSVRIRN